MFNCWKIYRTKYLQSTNILLRKLRVVIYYTHCLWIKYKLFDIFVKTVCPVNYCNCSGNSVVQ